ncbi:hypothetical protein IMSAGC001_04149 [Bacteroides acidifaciens]|uniref:Uncharacterized protein n=1 Tax=Bacteroides acidifaciens TaxID=85831 RepID=A0A7J0A8H8_9BACE|nr:hypothetical protein IMSAGC001_04149 [Bacteroides acidifaciens]
MILYLLLLLLYFLFDDANVNDILDTSNKIRNNILSFNNIS